MTSFQYFSDDEILAIGDKTLELVGYDPASRNVILGGMPPRFRARLPGGIAGIPPLTAMRADLQYLNSVDRLDNGVVPLKTWLRDALTLTGGEAGAELLRQRHDDIEIRTTGAPRIDASQLPELKEVVVHRDDMLPHLFMQRGLEAARAVAKLSVPRHDGGKPTLNAEGKPLIYLGTGWLIATRLMLTNHHVINARDEGEPPASEADLRQQATASVAVFDYDLERAAGTALKLTELVAWNDTLDYALLRLDSTGVSRAPIPVGQKLAPVNTAEVQIAVNIIQHPDGLAKKFGIRNNLLTAATDTELRYFTDTLRGSSGSPVLNDQWEAIGLHRGAAWVKGVKFNGRDVAYVNVGTQVSAIRQDLARRYAGKIPELQI